MQIQTGGPAWVREGDQIKVMTTNARGEFGTLSICTLTSTKCTCKSCRLVTGSASSKSRGSYSKALHPQPSNEVTDICPSSSPGWLDTLDTTLGILDPLVRPEKCMSLIPRVPARVAAEELEHEATLELGELGVCGEVEVLGVLALEDPDHMAFKYSTSSRCKKSVRLWPSRSPHGLPLKNSSAPGLLLVMFHPGISTSSTMEPCERSMLLRSNSARRDATARTTSESTSCMDLPAMPRERNPAPLGRAQLRNSSGSTKSREATSSLKSVRVGLAFLVTVASASEFIGAASVGRREGFALFAVGNSSLVLQLARLGEQDGAQAALGALPSFRGVCARENASC